jgi:hypothetical protein
MKKQRKHKNDMLKIEALSILIAGAGYALTHDPRWLLLLLAILGISLCFHSLAARWGRPGRRAGSFAHTGGHRKQVARKRTLKPLPRLRISSAAEMYHPAKHSVHTACYSIDLPVEQRRRGAPARTAAKAPARTRRTQVTLAA